MGSAAAHFKAISTYGGVVADRRSKLRMSEFVDAVALEAAALGGSPGRADDTNAVRCDPGGVIAAFEIRRAVDDRRAGAREDLDDALHSTRRVQPSRGSSAAIAAIYANYGTAWCSPSRLSYLAVLGSLAAHQRHRGPGSVLVSPVEQPKAGFDTSRPAIGPRVEGRHRDLFDFGFQYLTMSPS